MIGSVCVPWVTGWSLNQPLSSSVRKYLLTRTTSVLILESLPYNESRVDSLIGWSGQVLVSHWLRTWHTEAHTDWSNSCRSSGPRSTLSGCRRRECSGPARPGRSLTPWPTSGSRVWCSGSGPWWVTGLRSGECREQQVTSQSTGH